MLHRSVAFLIFIQGLVCCFASCDLTHAKLDECDRESSAGAHELLEAETSLLQLFFKNATQAVPSSVARLREAIPVKWLHIPKAGTSFINALIHLPGVCPGPGADPNFCVNEERYGTRFEAGFLGECPELCPGMICNPHFSHHEAIRDDDDYLANYSGRAFAMFRQPEQRLISSWHEPMMAGERIPITSWAQMMGGLMVRQLSGSDDVDLAIERLRGLAFVGITEEWDLTICLLHTMFGGECVPAEFTNVRPGTLEDDDDLYDTAILDGWTDEVDRPLYAEARQIFMSRLDEFNVSPDSCEPCWSAGAKE